MPVDVSIHSGNYVRSVYYGVVSSGDLLGQTATAPAAGDADGSIMRELEAIKNWPLQPSEADTPVQLGSGGAYKRFINRSNDLPAGEATFGASDKTFQALVQSMVKRNESGGMFVPVQPYSPTFRDFMMLVQGPAQSSESASMNEEMWEGTVFLNVKVNPRLRTYQTNTLPDYPYSIVANYGTKHIWGEDLDSTADGDTKMVGLDYTWPYQAVAQRWTGNNVLTTFNIGKNVAEDSADNFIVAENGTILTWVTGAPGAGEYGITEAATDLLVFGTAPASDAVVIGFFGFLGS